MPSARDDHPGSEVRRNERSVPEGSTSLKHG
jgi:hypothetical protein